MALTRYRTVDGITAAYNGALAVIWLRHAPSFPPGWSIAVAHGLGVLLPFLLRQLPATRSLTMKIVSAAYPLVLVAAFWTEIDLLRGFATTAYDAIVVQWDLAIFGAHLHLTWPAALTEWWAVEIIFFSYFVYYGVVLGPPVALVLQQRDRQFRDAVTQMIIVFVGCYFAFIFFPVDGPQHYGPATPDVVPTGIFPSLVAFARESGGSVGASFPSSHVAVSVTAALLAWRYFPRWVAGLLSLEAVGVSVATFFTQNHYAVDALAGAAWAVAVQVAVLPLLRPREAGVTTPPKPKAAAHPLGEVP